MRNNEDLDLRIRLGSEPALRAEDISVTVEDDLVKLKGFVRSYAEQRVVEAAVKRHIGSRPLADELVVDLPGYHYRTDSEITGAAINAIKWITTVPAEKIKVTAQRGRLALEGIVDDECQKEAVEDAVRHLSGIVGVTNRIEVKPPQFDPGRLGHMAVAPGLN